MVIRALTERAVLLLQDKELPSVVGIMTGERLSTSWWNHKRAHEIFACLESLEDHSDVLVSRLIGGKVTFIHRRLWPACLAVATSNQPWQTAGLSPEATELLSEVRRRGGKQVKGPAARELQNRLLIAAEEVHTESGRHEIALQTWKAWAEKRGPIDRVAVAAAREELEVAIEALGARRSALPWHRYSQEARG